MFLKILIESINTTLTESIVYILQNRWHESKIHIAINDLETKTELQLNQYNIIVLNLCTNSEKHTNILDSVYSLPYKPLTIAIVDNPSFGTIQDILKYEIDKIIKFQDNDIKLGTELVNSIVSFITRKHKSPENILSLIINIVNDLDRLILFSEGDSSIILANNKFYETLDLSEESVLGQNVEKLSKFSDQDKIEANQRLNERKKRKITRFSIKHITKTHAPRFISGIGIPVFNKNNTFIGTVNVGKDVTAEKLVETRLSETINEITEKKFIYEIIVESLPGRIYFLNENGLIIDLIVNNPPYDSFSEQRKNHPIDDFIDPKLAEKLKNLIKQSIATKEIIEFEFSNSPTFANQYLEARIIPQNKTEVVVLIKDISEQKQNELKATTLASDLKQSNEELTLLAGEINIQLKVLLLNIKKQISTLLKDKNSLVLNDFITQLVNIQQKSNEMISLIDDLYNLTKLDQSKDNLELVDIKELCKEIIKNIDLSNNVIIHLSDQLPTIKCNKTLVYHLFLNLIVNAIKYNDKPQKEISISAKTLNNYFYEFSVKDNGIGIEEKYHKMIFNMFETIPGHIKGTGLGLSIVKKVVDSYGGTIKIISKMGEGSTFIFTLPESPLI